MATKNYVPKCCRGDDAICTGSVELKTLGIEEKMTLLAEEGVDIGDNGESTRKAGSSNLSFLVKSIRAAKPKYVKVDITHKETGTRYESYEDLDSDDIGHGIITEIAGAMLNGYKVGNG